MESTRVPFGFRFHPKDDLLLYHLARKAAGKSSELEAFVKEHNLYGDQEPSEFFDNTTEKTMYFLTKLKKKSKNRIDRTVGNKGTWVCQNMKPIKNGTTRKIIGRFRNFVYQRKDGSMPNGCKWLMKEFSLPDDVPKHAIYKDYVICRIKKKDQQQESEGTGGIVQQGERILETMLATQNVQQRDDDFDIMIMGAPPPYCGNTEYNDVLDSIMLPLATAPALTPAEAIMEEMVQRQERDYDLEMIMELCSTAPSGNTTYNVLESMLPLATVPAQPPIQATSEEMALLQQGDDDFDIMIMGAPSSGNTEYYDVLDSIMLPSDNELESMLQLATVPALTPTQAAMEEMAQLQYQEMMQFLQQERGEGNQELMQLQQQEREEEMVQLQQEEGGEENQEMMQLQHQEREGEMVQLQQEGGGEENQEMMQLQHQEREEEMVQLQQGGGGEDNQEMMLLQHQEREGEMVQLQQQGGGEENQEMMQLQQQEGEEEMVQLQQQEIRDETIFAAREDEASGLRYFSSDQRTQFDYFDNEQIMPQGTGYEQHHFASNLGATDTELDIGTDLWSTSPPYYYST